jgi:2-hydroxychromene-2-carboxylate isomerase
MATTVDCYLSLNSPWTYLGSGRLMAMRRRLGFAVAVKPAKFGDVFQATGGLPVHKRPPARQAYRLVELERWSTHLAIPINLQPRHFPGDETAGVRLVIAAALTGQDALALSSEIGRALWEREESIADDATLAAAAERAGVDLSRLRREAPPAPDLDAAWENNTNEAIARGVFGAPSYVLPTGKIFWGQDRLEFLERAIVTGSGAG